MTAPASFAAAYERYSGSNRDTRARLWELCMATYTESQTVSCAKLADTIRVNKSSVEDWATCGWLAEYCNGFGLQVDEVNGFPVVVRLHGAWHESDILSYDHLLRLAKTAKRYELSPQEILERVNNAISATFDGKPQTAESLERDIEEAHEPQAVLLRRDLKRIGKRLQQNISSLEFRGASNRLVLAFRILERRMAQELARLEAE